MNNKQKVVVLVLIILNLVNIFLLARIDNIKKNYSLLISDSNITMFMKKKVLISPIINIRKFDVKKLKWESSDSDVIDVYSCSGKAKCFLKPNSVGNVVITISYTDNKKKIKVSDSISIKVLESEKINFYFPANSETFAKRLYAAKESDDIYKDNPLYEKSEFSYTCSNTNCEVYTGEYNSLIFDSNGYLSISSNSLSSGKNVFNYMKPCINPLCVEKKFSVDKSNIRKVIDDSTFGIGALLVGNTDMKYSGIYSSIGLKKVDFIGYKKVSNSDYNILMYDSEKSYLYNWKDGNMLTFNTSWKNFYAPGNGYYYFSQNIDDVYHNCTIMDSNFNPLFNSKKFDYALIVNDRLFTYELSGSGKALHVYDLLGNEQNNYFGEGFEMFEFVDYYAVGRKDNKLTVIRLDNSQVSNSSLDINDYKFAGLLNRKEKDELVKEISVDFLADNEFVFKFVKDNKEIYVDIPIIYGTGLPKIEVKILLEKEID